MSDITEQSTVSVRLVITLIGALVGLFIAVTPGIIGTYLANQTATALAQHQVKAEADKKELQVALQSVREEQVRAQERTASIVNALGRVEKQLEQSTVVVRAGGRAQ